MTTEPRISVAFVFLATTFLSDFGFGINWKVDTRRAVVETCEPAALVYPAMLGETLRREEGIFCFDKGFTFITSKNCVTDCDLVSKAKADQVKLQYSAIGNPGSWLCESYGGKAQTLFLEYKGKKNKQDFCFLGVDIVSTPYLLSLRTDRKKAKNKMESR